MKPRLSPNIFFDSTPIREIAELNIGSRPASRKASQKIEDLRAIPWGFSWGQCRLTLPGWYGFGSAVEQFWRAWRASTASSTCSPVGRYRVLFSDNITDRMLGSQALMAADLCRRLGVAPGKRMRRRPWSAWAPPRAPACATRGRRCWSTTTRW
jgi:hypothetical protein